MGNRNLYLKTVSVEEALKKYIDRLNELGVIKNLTEIIKTEDSLSRITAKPIYANCNSPLFTASAMDGISVDSTLTKGASEETPIILSNTQYKVVDTGDPVKTPYDCVIMAEDVIDVGNGNVKIVSPVGSWENVRPIGEDIVEGEMVLLSNHKIKPIDIGALIASGNIEIECIKKLSVGVIPTGDEIINPKKKPEDGDIIDSNSYMLKSLLNEMDCNANRYDIVKDNYDLLKNAINLALAENDMVIINAGSSAGREDFTVHVLRELGEVVVHGVSMKPGKPVIMAIVNNKPVIGLPGYPLSAYLAFDTFVKPVINMFYKIHTEKNDEITATASRIIVSSLKYREYVRVKVGKVHDKYVATPLDRGAASQMSMVRADGILIIPQNSEGVIASETVSVKLLKDKQYIDNTLVSIGSHDILLDFVSDLMNKKFNDVHFQSTHVGSLAGLMALKRGETIIAPTHLLNEENGIYNIDILKELFMDEVDENGKNLSISLIKGFKRIQGIVVKKGNPKNIKSIKDLLNCKFVNRQRGSGTRVLFDYLLKKENIDSSKISGYDKELTTHMSICAAVKSGEVDCGIAIKSVANVMKLDFIEIGSEEYDFAILTKDLDDIKIKKFIEVIRSNELKNKLDEVGGYGYYDDLNIIKVL